MDLTYQESVELEEDLIDALNGKYDGSRKNIIAPECPFCGKTGYKFGIYVGKETRNKKPFMWNCFSCGKRGMNLKPLLYEIGRMDLMPSQTTDLDTKIGLDEEFRIGLFDDKEETELKKVSLPKSYTRLFFNKYLNDRGYTYLDFNYFEAGETSQADMKFRNYIVFPVIENKEVVGYVARHIYSKMYIEEHNRTAKNKILRYKNSSESDGGNDFQYLLYNIDAVQEGITKTVILVEGIFDCVALTRKLNLYKSNDIAVCATFGKQTTETKMLKLQNKGVKNIVLGYDGDAKQFTADSANMLDEYFNVLIADIEDKNKDWDDLDVSEIYDIFTNKLKTPVEYNLNKILI